MRRGRGRRERLFGGAFGRAILCGNVALRGGVVSQRVGVELYRAQARVERVEQRPDIARILAKITLADLRGALQMNAGHKLGDRLHANRDIVGKPKNRGYPLGLQRVLGRVFANQRPPLKRVDACARLVEDALRVGGIILGLDLGVLGRHTRLDLVDNRPDNRGRQKARDAQGHKDRQCDKESSFHGTPQESERTVMTSSKVVSPPASLRIAPSCKGIMPFARAALRISGAPACRVMSRAIFASTVSISKMLVRP